MPSEEWKKRAFIADEDQDVVVSQWCSSYLRGREGVARGAFLPHAKVSETQSLGSVREASLALWADQEPLVRGLIASPGVRIEVVCDPERARRSEAGPAVVWAFAATSGDVVHYVSVKRKVAPLLGADMVRDLLGSRLDRPCWFTHELVEMRTGSCGQRLPQSWSWDSLFIARLFAREGVGARRAA